MTEIRDSSSGVNGFGAFVEGKLGRLFKEHARPGGKHMASDFNLVSRALEKAEKNQELTRKGKKRKRWQYGELEAALDSIDNHREVFDSLAPEVGDFEVGLADSEEAIGSRRRVLAQLLQVDEAEVEKVWELASSSKDRLRGDDKAAWETVDESTQQRVSFLIQLFREYGIDSSTWLKGKIKDIKGTDFILLDAEEKRVDKTQFKDLIERSLVEAESYITDDFLEGADREKQLGWAVGVERESHIANDFRLSHADEPFLRKVYDALIRADEAGFDERGFSYWRARAILEANIVRYREFVGSQKMWKGAIRPAGNIGHTDYVVEWLEHISGLAEVLDWKEVTGDRDKETNRPLRPAKSTRTGEALRAKARQLGINDEIAIKAHRLGQMWAETIDESVVQRKITEVDSAYALADILGFGRTIREQLEQMTPEEKARFDKMLLETSGFSIGVVRLIQRMIGYSLKPEGEDDDYRIVYGRPLVYADIEADGRVRVEDGRHLIPPELVERRVVELVADWKIENAALQLMAGVEVEVSEPVLEEFRTEASAQMQWEMWARETLRAYGVYFSNSDVGKKYSAEAGDLAGTRLPFNPDNQLMLDLMVKKLRTDSRFQATMLKMGMDLTNTNIYPDHYLAELLRASLSGYHLQGYSLLASASAQINRAVYEYRARHNWNFDYDQAKTELSSALPGAIQGKSVQLDTALLVLALQDAANWGQKVDFAKVDKRAGDNPVRQAALDKLRQKGEPYNTASMDLAIYYLLYEYDTYAMFVSETTDYRAGIRDLKFGDLMKKIRDVGRHTRRQRGLVGGHPWDFLITWHARYKVEDEMEKLRDFSQQYQESLMGVYNAHARRLLRYRQLREPMSDRGLLRWFRGLDTDSAPLDSNLANQLNDLKRDQVALDRATLIARVSRFRQDWQTASTEADLTTQLQAEVARINNNFLQPDRSQERRADSRLGVLPYDHQTLTKEKNDEGWLKELHVWMSPLELDPKRSQAQAKERAELLEALLRLQIDRATIAVLLSRPDLSKQLIRQAGYGGLYQYAVLDNQGRLVLPSDARFNSVKERREAGLSRRADWMEVYQKVFWPAMFKGKYDWDVGRFLAAYGTLEADVYDNLGMRNNYLSDQIAANAQQLSTARITAEGEIDAPEALRRFSRYYLGFELDDSRYRPQAEQLVAFARDHPRLIMYGFCMLDIEQPESTWNVDYVMYMVGNMVPQEQVLGKQPSLKSLTETYFKNPKAVEVPDWFNIGVEELSQLGFAEALTFEKVMLKAKTLYDGCPHFSEAFVPDTRLVRQMAYLTPDNSVIGQIQMQTEGLYNFFLKGPEAGINITVHLNQVRQWLMTENARPLVGFLRAKLGLRAEAVKQAVERSPADWDDAFLTRIVNLMARPKNLAQFLFFAYGVELKLDRKTKRAKKLTPDLVNGLIQNLNKFLQNRIVSQDYAGQWNNYKQIQKEALRRLIKLHSATFRRNPLGLSRYEAHALSSLLASRVQASEIGPQYRGIRRQSLAMAQETNWTLFMETIRQHEEMQMINDAFAIQMFSEALKLAHPAEDTFSEAQLVKLMDRFYGTAEELKRLKANWRYHFVYSLDLNIWQILRSVPFLQAVVEIVPDRLERPIILYQPSLTPVLATTALVGIANIPLSIISGTNWLATTAEITENIFASPWGWAGIFLGGGFIMKAGYNYLIQKKAQRDGKPFTNPVFSKSFGNKILAAIK